MHCQSEYNVFLGAMLLLCGALLVSVSASTVLASIGMTMAGVIPMCIGLLPSTPLVDEGIDVDDDGVFVPLE